MAEDHRRETGQCIWNQERTARFPEMGIAKRCSFQGKGYGVAGSSRPGVKHDGFQTPCCAYSRLNPTYSAEMQAERKREQSKSEFCYLDPAGPEVPGLTVATVRNEALGVVEMARKRTLRAIESRVIEPRNRQSYSFCYQSSRNYASEQMSTGFPGSRDLRSLIS